MRKYKIAFLVSHPIQYFSPLFEKMNDNEKMDLTVYYCSDETLKTFKDRGFNREIKWDIPLLSGYKYKFLKNYSPKPSIYNGFLGLMNWGIVKELKNKKYDALIIHGWNYFTHTLSIITAKLSRIKLFIRGDNPLNQELKKSYYKIFLKRIILQNFLFKLIDVFLYVGQENKRFYKFYGVPEKKLFFMPYAVENERFIKNFKELKNQRDEIKEEIGISSQKIVILFCGKLIDKKRPFDLLKGYERIENKNKALLFVGDGYLKKELENYVKEKNLKNVFFLGFKNQTELPKYYTIADIFVLSSSSETWGLVVNEAMCFGLPVIVSDMVGCGKDLVRYGENGFIYPVGNIEKLSFYISKLLEDKKLRESMGKKSLEIIKKWSYEKNIKGILSAIQNTEKTK